MAQITETRKASNALYQSLKDNGFNSLPSEEVFYNTLQDSVQASNIYQSLKDNGFKLPSKESFYKTLIEGYGQQPATPTASADGTYTESQLEEMGGGDMTDKAPENGAVVVQKQDKKKDLNVPNSPLQPEQYKIPKLFDYTQRKKDYSNQDWNKKQEAMMEAVRPGSGTTFEERMNAMKAATEADETRKMVRGDYDKENFDTLFDKHVDPLFGEEKKKATEEAYNEYKSNTDGFHAPDVTGYGAMQNAFAAAVADEKYRDPFRVVNKTLQSTQEDPAFTDYILNRMGVSGKTADNGNSPQLTDEEITLFKRLFSTEASEVSKLITDRLYDTYKKAEAPESVLDYIAGKALNDNFVASLTNALIRRAANSSGMREQLRQLAYEQYGQSKEGFGGWSMRAAGAAAPFAVDMVTGGFALPSAVSETVVKFGIGQAAKQVEKEAVKRAVASGISKEAAAQAVEGIGERYLATNAPILNLTIRAAGSAANFGTYEAQMEAVRQFSEGKDEISAWDLFKKAVHGAMLGTVTGGIGGAIGKATQRGSLITKAAGDVVGIGAETGVFATDAILQKAYDEGVSIVDVDWAEPLGESAGMVIGMKGVGMAMNPGTLLQRYNKSKEYDLKLNKHNLEELQSLGYDLDNIFHGLRDLGNIAPMKEETIVRGYELKPGTTPSKRRNGTLGTEERVDDEAYRNIMESDQISSETKRKVHYLATGHVMTEEPVFGATIIRNEDGTANVETLNAKGQRVSLKDFKNEAEAQAYYDSIREKARANTIGGLERIGKETDPQIIESAKARTEQETGTSVDDLDQLSNLSKEEADMVLDNYVKNLQEAYMAKFNEGLKRIGELRTETEGKTGGEAGTDGTGGYEPPVTPTDGGTTPDADATETVAAGEAITPEANTAGTVVRSERRQAAYDKGTQAVQQNHAILAGIAYDRQLAMARMEALFTDNDPVLSHLKRDIYQAVASGNDVEVDRLMEMNAAYLDARQKEAVEQYRDAIEATVGVDDAVTGLINDYERQRREELRSITSSDGNITEVSLSDGTTAYHLSGDLNRKDGAVIVTNGQETKQVATMVINAIGESQPMEAILRADVDAYGQQIEQEMAGYASATNFVPGSSVDFAIAGKLFQGSVAGQDAAGNIIFNMPDGSEIPMTPQDAQKAVQDANAMLIQAQLKQEKDTAIRQAQEDRFTKGIVGYSEGKADVTDAKTDAKAAAEYLESLNPDNHTGLLKSIDSEIDKLNEQSVAARERIRELSSRQAIAGLSEQEEIALAETNQTIDSAEARRRKWGEIRQALMTPEEREKFEADRQKTIKKVMDDTRKSFTIDKVTFGDAIPTGQELLERFAEKGDAADYVEKLQKDVKRYYTDDLYPSISKVKDAINDYRQGLTDISEGELADLSRQLISMEAEVDNLTNRQNELGKLASSIGRLYVGREKQQLTPHEYKMQQLEKETNKEKKLKLAREAFKEDEEALAVLNDLEPQDIYEHIADNLGAGSLNWEGKQVGEHYVRGVSDMVGKDKKRGIGKDSDTIGYNSFLAPEGQGEGYDVVVHAISEGSPYSTEDVANALYEMLTSANKPTDISHRIIDERIARAEDIYEANLEREREAEEEAKREALDNEIIQMTGMEPDEYDAYISNLEQRLAEQEGYRTSDDYFNQIVEDYEREQGIIGGGTETGALGVQGEEANEGAAQAAVEEGAAEPDVITTAKAIFKPITDKYHSLAPIEFVSINSEENVRKLAEETHENYDEFSKKLKEEKMPAAYNPDTKKIYIFAENLTGDYAEEGFFHENLHRGLHQYYGDGLREIAEAYWDASTSEASEANKRKVEEAYKSQPEEIKEEYLVHTMAKNMTIGTADKLIGRLNDEHQEIINNILTNIGYDRAKEAEQRAAEREDTSLAGEGLQAAGSRNGGIKSNIQGLEDYSEEEIKKYVREFVQEQVEMADADAEIVDIAIIGSRTTGTAKPDSDLDVLVEYKGKEREDDFYNLLDDADEPLTIGGISVDINPITEGKSGTIAQFLERNKDYKKEEPANDDLTKGEDLEHIPFTDRLKAAKGETNTNPTEEQKKAGNYKMGHIHFGGYRMSIENPKGSTRSGKDANGKAWSIQMQDTYGYIGKKYGTDGDHLDFFINDDADLDNWNGRVYVVDQKNEDGTFDEHKVMYGYHSFKEAKEAYERNYEKGWWDKHVMQMTGVKKDTFDAWLEDSDHKRKPFAEYSRTRHSETITDNVDQLLADVRERAMKNVNELANVTTTYKEGELEKRTIAELEQLKKKREQDASMARYAMKAFNIEEGSEKEHNLKMREAEAKADIAAINEALKAKKEEMQARIEQQEIGFAVTDRLNEMGYDVETDPKTVRRVRKQAEQDQSEEGKMRHMQTSDGTVYGFVYRGKMYMDIRKIDGNLPLHEYAHPWCEAFRKMNPEGWKAVVKTMQTDKDTWEFVKQLNPDLKTEDDIAEEMIAKGTGEKGEQYAKAEYERMHGKDTDWKSKWNNIWKNIAKAIQDFWKQVGDYLHIKYETPEQVYDQVIRDFANNINPKKKIEKWLKERDKDYLEAVKTGDETKAKELFDAALRENIGSGIVPFVSTGGYRGKLQHLAHGVKTRDPKVIAEVADLMIPIIPKDAVLVPTPSRTGEATDMLDLANAIAERTGAPVADVLKSEPRDSQYEAKYAGKPITSSEMGITLQGKLPEGKLPVVIDNVVDTGNTAEACVRALGKGIVASLADSRGRFKRVASLKSAEPVVTDKDGKVVPLSKRFEFDNKYLESVVQRQQLEEPETVDEVETTLAQIERKSDAYKEMVKRDQDRIFELGFSKKYENHPNRKLFNGGRLFGVANDYLEEAAFQLLGYERFSIAQIFPNGMPNPWEDIYHILEYAIEKKGLNPDYLKKVSNRNMNAPDDKYGMKPEIMPSDDWSAYTKSIMSGEKHLFTSEELREIAALLPQRMKEELFHDLINLSRMKTIEDMKNHLLVMNDGDNAQQLIKAVRAQVDDARANGAKKITYAMVTDFVKNALNKTEVLPESEKELPQFMVEGNLFSDEDFEEPKATVVSIGKLNKYGLNENSPIGKKLTELKGEAGKSALVGYAEDGMYIFPGEDGLTMTDIVNIKSKQLISVDGMECVAIPERDLSIVSAKLVAEGYKLAITDVNTPDDFHTYKAGDKLDIVDDGGKQHSVDVIGFDDQGNILVDVDGFGAMPIEPTILDMYRKKSEDNKPDGTVTEPKDAVDEMLNEVDRRKEAAKVRAEKQADKTEAEKIIDDYLKEQKGDSEETRIRKRATKATLKLLKDNKVPFRLADEKEEKKMLKLFSMFNKEAVKNFARKVSIRSNAPHGHGRYCVYNMEDPFGVPMYAEKLSVAKEIQDFMNRTKGSSWEILDIGYKDEAVEIPEELKEAANFQAMMGWHGSGAKFEKFDHRHMGSGEGNQSYGWGTYITEVEGIGRMYAESMGSRHTPATYKGITSTSIALMSEKEYKKLGAANEAQRDILARIVGSCNFGYGDPVRMIRVQREGLREILERKQAVIEDAKEQLEEEKDELDEKRKERLNNRIRINEKIVKETQESLAFVGSLDPKDFKGWSKPNGKYLYKVDIPEDTGKNYFDWTEHLTERKADEILSDLREYLLADKKYGWNGSEIRLDKELETMKKFFGGAFYGRMAVMLGNSVAGARTEGQRLASELLSKHGYIGIKYPSEYRTGGREDGAKNYVVFNENDAKITDTIQFMVETPDTEAPVFFSNAMKAVEGIKQEKATPEQWLKMIEKAGGLKAGEDKWIGLSEWLKEQDKKSLTKQEVMDFIRQNQIQIEEDRYSQDTDVQKNIKDYIRDTIGNGKSLDELQDEVDAHKESADRYDRLGDNPTDADMDDYLIECMIEDYGDDFSQGYSIINGEIEYFIDPYDLDEDTFNIKYASNGNKAINETRLEYTTEELKNKREVALTVPTIEPYNEDDQIHFGDAGAGRAIAWARFGETTTGMKGEGSSRTILDDIERRIGTTTDYSKMSDEDAAKRAFANYLWRGENVNLAWMRNSEIPSDVGADRAENVVRLFDKLIDDNKESQKVCVIDEIQSKRHQDAREQGYITKEYQQELERLTKAYRKTQRELDDFEKHMIDKYNVFEEIKTLTTEETERRLRNMMTEEELEEYDKLLQANEQASMEKSKFVLANGDLSRKVPEAPFEKNWHELAMKRMLRYAAEHGYDKIAWTTGEQQAERYSLGGVIYQITSTPYKAQAPNESDGHDLLVNMRDGTRYEMFVQPDGTLNYGVDNNNPFDGKNVMEVFGKELGAKIMSATEETEIKGNGLRVGAEGMKGFYDQILPRFMEKYCKKWGVKPEMIDLPEIGQKMWSVDITPEMRESVMQGQPMFQAEKNGIMGWSDKTGVTLTKKGLNPNTPIHECNHLWDGWCQKEQPELWKEIVEAMKTTPMWQQIKKNPNYRSIWDDDDKMASEVKSRLTGATSEEEFTKAAFKPGSSKEIINKVKSVLKRWWESILRLFGKTTKTIGDEWKSVEAIRRMTLRDLMEGDFDKVLRVMEESEESSAMKGEIIEKTLMGVHNISEEKLRKAIKLGGLANPSLAVVDTKNGIHTAYGDISLIPKASLIDARTGNNAGTYAGDAYTPTYPYVDRIATNQGEKHFESISKEVAGGNEDLERHLRHNLFDYAEGNSTKLHLLYLLQKGIKPDFIMERIDHDKKEFDAITKIFGKPQTTMPSDATEEQRKTLEDLMVNTYENRLRGKSMNLRDKDKIEELIQDRVEEYRKKITDDNGRLYFAEGDEFVYANWKDEQRRQKKQVDWYSTDNEASYRVAKEGLSEDYEKWKEEQLFSDDDFEERLFVGYTRDGNRKYIPNTIENASRLMNKESDVNSYDQHGLNATKASLLKKMSSLSDIRKAKYLLQGEEAYNKTQGEMSDELFDIIKQLSDMQEISDNSFSNIDYAENRLQEAIVKRDPIGYLNKEYGYDIDKNGDFASQVMNFIEKAKELPAKYFETKFKRPVGLNEFSIAVVPEKTSKEVIKALKSAGLEVRTYNGTDEDRQNVVMDAVGMRDDILFHIETNEYEVERLEREPKEIGYRNVVMNPDGTLGSPMANRLSNKGVGRQATSMFEFGKWERSDENPQLADENGKINLIKPNGKPVEGVDYNPYIHIRPNKINRQFKEAWRRPELIYVETEYPKSELEGDYQAEKAAKTVGKHPWGSNGEELILSRWDKPVRMVPWEEVADDWEKEFKDRGVEFDIIPPALLPILAERGVEILPPHKGMGKACEEAYKAFLAGKPQGTVKPEPREISATDYQKNNAFIEHDQQFVDYISEKTGISFNKNKNSNSWYGNKDGREIRISDHFNKRTDQDKYYFSEDADYIVSKINGVNPFKHFSQGDTIRHIVPKIGDVEFVSYDEDKGFVEVRLSDGTVHKYDEERFSLPENFKFQKAAGDVEAPNEYDVAVRDKLIDDYLKPAGIGLYSDAEAEKILEENKSDVKLSQDKKNAAETAPLIQKEGSPADISTASGAKILKNLETLTKKLENLPKLFKTSEGEVYGFALNGKIGIDRRTAKADTPIHEYGHLWAAALRKVNPEEWKNVVKLMKGIKDVWDAVKRDYADLKTEDDIAEEVLTQYSGSRGRQRFYEERERVLSDQSISGDEKVRLFTIFENVKRALHAFWGRVADFLHIHYTSAEQVADQVLGDLLSGVNPEREAKKYASETGRIKAKAEQDGTFMKAPDGSRSKLSEKGWLAARTNDFKKWIGGDWEQPNSGVDSKLDRNGEPQEKYVQGYLERPRKPGKPKKKDSETMAEYFNRLRLWGQAIKDWPDTVEQWKAVVYRHDGSALPDETAIHEKWMQKYEDDLAKWKEDNALPADAEPPTEKPVAGDADPLDYMKTMADWRKAEALWKTAPDKQDYEREAEAEVYSMLAALELKHHPMSYSARMKQMGASLKQIREAVLTQKRYDQTTVQSVVDFAKNFMSMGFGDNIGRGDLESILTSVKRAVGARSIKDSVDSIMEKLVDNHLRNLSNFLEKMTSIKDKRLNPTGVEVQGELDLEGQRAINEFRRMRATRLTPDEINVRLNELADKIMNDPENRSQWEAEYDGAHAALTYAEGVAANKKACMDAEDAIRDAVKSYSQSGRSYAAQQELLTSLHRGLSDLLFERIDLYGQLFDELGGILSESRERAKDFREREKARVFNIHRLATIDMAGKDATDQRQTTWKQALNNSAVARLPLSSLGTFEQLMKQFGSRHPNGEGAMYNHFMRGFIDATNKEYQGLENAKGMLDAKASEVFGKKMQWSHLYYLERSMPTMDVTWRDNEGNQHTYTLSQGNMLAIYMWSKMPDGEMKLTKMDITKDDVMAIKAHIDPKLIELADWIQQEFLPTIRTKYNKVHEQEFGASMAEVEDYFPLRIVKDAIQKEDDLTADPSMDNVLPSTTTGSIIKRTVNTKPLDILNTDALSLVIEHIEEMEKWAAFTHWNKDINTLLSYNHFKNQVKNMDTIYGSGDELWDTFRAACQMAAGTYRAKHGKADKAMTVIASGVTGAKIAFRPYTALKQLLSAPAFLYDASVKNYATYFMNPKNFFHDNFVWAMENLPILRKRWHSRDMGDTRLSDKTGYGYWHTQTKKWVAQYGMWANGMIDVLTCAAGARSVYETRLESYKKQGIDEAKAKEKALQDAAMAYNMTQQSSEGAFVTQIQKDRTLFANMWTVFRNSPMSYTRQSVDAIRNLKRMYSNKEDMLYSLERTLREEEGLNESDAKKAARAEYKRALWKNMAKLAVCAFVLPWLWELGSKVPYLLFGDDDELKKRMLADVTAKELVAGPVEGLTFGNAVNTLWGAATNHEVRDNMSKKTLWKSVSESEVQPLPMFGDMGTMLEKFGYDEAAGIQDMVNIACQMATGINPQTLTDPINASIDASRGDITKAKEIELFLMRVIMVPTESAQNIYLDELGMDAKKAQSMTYDEMAERYADYKFGKNTPMFGWVYSDTAEAKRRESYMKRFDMAAQDRIHIKDEESLRQQFENSGSQKERKLISKEVAARQDSEDYYVKNGGTTEKSKQQRTHYLVNRDWNDMLEDMELERLNREAKAAGNKDRVDAIKETRKTINELMGDLVSDPDAWNELRKVRKEALDSLRSK